MYMRYGGACSAKAAAAANGIATNHIHTLSLNAAYTVSPPDRHNPTIKNILNAFIGYMHMRIRSMICACVIMCDSTLNKAGSASESGNSSDPIKTAKAGINHAHRHRGAAPAALRPADRPTDR